jgi:hypothetical protein
MDLNTLGISLIGSLVLYIGYQYQQFSKSNIIPTALPKLLISQSTGKQRSLVAKTGHASMSTELQRRRVIQTIGVLTNKFDAKLGSVSGAIETYFITGICTCKPKPPPPIIPPPICPTDELLDGGNASDEFCPVHGWQNIYDAGNAETEIDCNN